MSCCHCQGAEKFFNKSTAANELKKYRKKGPNKTTRILLDALKTNGVAGMKLLDIGGGIGVIQHELLQHGIGKSISVDASPAYIESVKEHAKQQGTEERIQYYQGDFVEIAAEVPPADVVTLHRVICCYPDMPTQVQLSLEKALKLYALVYPRDSWWPKLALGLLNFTLWLRRNPFRTFVHPENEVDRLIRENGFKQNFKRKTIFWQVVVYQRK